MLIIIILHKILLKLSNDKELDEWGMQKALQMRRAYEIF
jgi:hypothetical protein